VTGKAGVLVWTAMSCGLGREGSVIYVGEKGEEGSGYVRT
jgi:hypothetical protein